MEQGSISLLTCVCSACLIEIHTIHKHLIEYRKQKKQTPKILADNFVGQNEHAETNFELGPTKL
jgi:hypothetical protein